MYIHGVPVTAARKDKVILLNYEVTWTFAVVDLTSLFIMFVCFL